jgi:hypothetical protein
MDEGKEATNRFPGKQGRIRYWNLSYPRERRGLAREQVLAAIEETRETACPHFLKVRFRLTKESMI